MLPNELIKESREVINELSAYQAGIKSLSLNQFDRLLRLAQDLNDQFNAAIDSTSRSQDVLLQMREKLECVIADGSFEMDKKIDNEVAENRFGLFSSDLSPDDSGYDEFSFEDFDFQRNEFS